jgi:hypothetical protein
MGPHVRGHGVLVCEGRGDYGYGMVGGRLTEASCCGLLIFSQSVVCCPEIDEEGCFILSTEGATELYSYGLFREELRHVSSRPSLHQ